MAYRQPIRDYRWHRFDNSVPGGYDEEECDIWQGVTQYKAGFNPAIQEHSPLDIPEPALKEFFEVLRGGRFQEWVDNLTIGLWKAGEGTPVEHDELKRWPDEMKAAYFLRKGDNMEDFDPDKKELKLVEKIKGVWEQWEKMEGDHIPLERSLAGELRDFDINLDGTAHYGMLPDLLQDIRNAGLTPEDLAPLFRSAYDYVQMWETCAQRAIRLARQPKKHRSKR